MAVTAAAASRMPCRGATCVLGAVFQWALRGAVLPRPTPRPSNMQRGCGEAVVAAVRWCDRSRPAARPTTRCPHLEPKPEVVLQAGGVSSRGLSRLCFQPRPVSVVFPSMEIECQMLIFETTMLSAAVLPNRPTVTNVNWNLRNLQRTCTLLPTHPFCIHKSSQPAARQLFAAPQAQFKRVLVVGGRTAQRPHTCSALVVPVQLPQHGRHGGGKVARLSRSATAALPAAAGARHATRKGVRPKLQPRRKIIPRLGRPRADAAATAAVATAAVLPGRQLTQRVQQRRKRVPSDGKVEARQGGAARVAGVAGDQPQELPGVCVDYRRAAGAAVDGSAGEHQ
eukprot:354448-Chlamydomonas_euryale.AAC.3